MGNFSNLTLLDFAPLALTILIIVGAMIGSNLVLEKHYQGLAKYRYRIHMTKFFILLFGLLLVVVSLPFGDATRGQLLSLIGIVLSATIALSSTTFVGNAMAGIMLRSLRDFKIGDFIRVGDYFGRVAEMGVLHIEIQTEDRDLMTIPNLFVVTQPTKVIHSSGTIISAQVSLGYDVPHQMVESVLCEAAEAAGLADPFVWVTELGDFSVNYQINGLLTEVKQVISVRSNLRKMMLDHLHQANIEIVSPNFMNTRAYTADEPFIPKPLTMVTSDHQIEQPEDIVFDIAEEAATLEMLRENYSKLATQVDELETQLSGLTNDTQRKMVAKELDHLKRRKERMLAVIHIREGEVEQE